MNAPVPDTPRTEDAEVDHMLEAVELELALSFLDLGGKEFEEALRPVLEASGASLLFTLPCPVMEDASRVAAVSLGSGEERRVALVVLDAGGANARLERAAEGENPFSGLAASFTRVMERIPVVEEAA